MIEAVKPVVSIVMAVYNGEKYLKPTIETVLSQTLKDFEFIIVNDSSNDSTLNIVSSYHDPRIIIHNNNVNMGQTASLNTGLRMACGKYIARTDAGDISAPERLFRQVQYLDNHSNVDILGTAAFQYDIAGNCCGNVFMPNRASTILQRIFFACPVVHVSVMMRREKILQLGGYNESYRILADYGLWAKALHHGLRFWNLQEILTGYLVTPDSFGCLHGRGRSIQEAANIICEVAMNMTGIQLSHDQAEDLYSFFVFGPQDMDNEQMLKTEALFETLLRQLNVPRRDIDYMLLRSYLKMILRKSYGASFQKHKLKDVLHSILSKWRGGWSFHLFEDLNRYIKTLRYLNFSTIGVEVPNFIFEVGDKQQE